MNPVSVPHTSRIDHGERIPLHRAERAPDIQDLPARARWLRHGCGCHGVGGRVDGRGGGAGEVRRDEGCGDDGRSGAGFITQDGRREESGDVEVWAHGRAFVGCPEAGGLVVNSVADDVVEGDDLFGAESEGRDGSVRFRTDGTGRCGTGVVCGDCSVR